MIKLIQQPKYIVRLFQAGLTRLGFRGANGNPLLEDGLPGTNTRFAWQNYLRANEPEVVDEEKRVHITKLKYKDVNVPSRNFSNGRTNQALGVMLHHSAGSTMGSVSWCQNRKSGVSYHMIIDKDGTRYHLVKGKRVAWHAGRSAWRGRYGCNSFTVGVAFSGNTNNRMLTQEEVESFLEWFRVNKELYGWNRGDLLTHRQAAPRRKDDISETAFKQIMEKM